MTVKKQKQPQLVIKTKENIYYGHIYGSNQESCTSRLLTNWSYFYPALHTKNTVRKPLRVRHTRYTIKVEVNYNQKKYKLLCYMPKIEPGLDKNTQIYVVN